MGKKQEKNSCFSFGRTLGGLGVVFAQIDLGKLKFENLILNIQKFLIFFCCCRKGVGTSGVAKIQGNGESLGWIPWGWSKHFWAFRMGDSSDPFFFLKNSILGEKRALGEQIPGICWNP